MASFTSSAVRSPIASAVLTSHVALDGGVDVERPDAHRFERDDATERDHRDLAGAAADVDDHVAERLVDRQRRADRGRHRLLDEEGLARRRRAGPPRARPRCSTWVIADGTQMSTRAALEAGDARALEQHPDQALGDLEVGDRAAAQRPDRDDVARRAADHLPRVVPEREHLVGAAVHGDDRRLVEDDALAARVHEGVRGAEVDGEVA